MRPEYERLHEVDTVQCIWQQPAPHARDFEDSSIMNLQLGSSMQTMYQQMEFSDATIVVEGQTLRAHRAVLAAASPVFACMFRSNMQEGQTWFCGPLYLRKLLLSIGDCCIDGLQTSAAYCSGCSPWQSLHAAAQAEGQCSL